MGSPIVGFYALAAFVAGPVAYVAIAHSRLSRQKRCGARRFSSSPIMAIQAPLVIVQALFFASHVDEVGGTFGAVGGTHVQAVVMGFAWTVAVALLYGRRRSWLLPVGSIVAVVLLVSEAKAGFLFAAIGTIVVGLVRATLDPKRRVSTILGYAVLGVGAFSVLFVAYMFAGSLLPGGEQMAAYWSEWLTNPATIRNYLFSYNSLGNADRLEGVRLVLSQPVDDSPTGSSAGASESSRSRPFSGRRRSRPAHRSPERSTGRRAPPRRSTRSGWWASSCTSWPSRRRSRRSSKAWRPHGGELGISVTAAAAGSAVVFALSALLHDVVEPRRRRRPVLVPHGHGGEVGETGR